MARRKDNGPFFPIGTKSEMSTGEALRIALDVLQKHNHCVAATREPSHIEAEKLLANLIAGSYSAGKH